MQNALNIFCCYESICLVCMVNEVLEVWCILCDRGGVKCWGEVWWTFYLRRLGGNCCTLGEYWKLSDVWFAWNPNDWICMIKYFTKSKDISRFVLSETLIDMLLFPFLINLSVKVVSKKFKFVKCIFSNWLSPNAANNCLS